MELEPTHRNDHQLHESDRVAPKIYQVSSRHLISASAKWRSELTGLWSESRRSEDGKYHLATSDWDAEAFEIMLNIFHLRHRKVPRVVGLETLARMAVLVDYYRCWEAVDLIAPMWIEAARKHRSVPTKYERDTMLWMVVSWVFKLQEEFTKTTKVAIMQSEELDVRDMELGIPPTILDELSTRRIQAIEKVIVTCHQFIDDWSGDYQCPQRQQSSFLCGAMLIGATIKGLKRIKLLSPQPQPPFPGRSLGKICGDVTTMPWASWYHEPSSYGGEHRCSVRNTLHPAITAIWSNIKGLVLEDFKDRGEGLVELTTESSANATVHAPHSK